VKKLGAQGLDALSPPADWDESAGERILVNEGSKEYQEVSDFFNAGLYSQRAYIEVIKIERIQNLPLWQSYSVKNRP
jgi:hypothetical protein